MHLAVWNGRLLQRDSQFDPDYGGAVLVDLGRGQKESRSIRRSFGLTARLGAPKNDVIAVTTNATHAFPPKLERAGSAWLEVEKPHFADRTYEIYEVALRCHLKPALEALLLCENWAQSTTPIAEKTAIAKSSASAD
jgi:hypothetical protein